MAPPRQEFSETGRGAPPVPDVWRLSPRSIAVRLFITCWLVYGMFFATNIVREHYLAMSIGDQLSFRLDDYGGLHPDLFEKEGYGWHIGNNPGGSMVGAIPYGIARPVIDTIVQRVLAGREARGETMPPSYDSPQPIRRAFYAETWRRGFDVKFGLAALVMQLLAMAPLSALGVVLMFLAMRHVTGSDRTALVMALVYAFATPVFYRTGFLNHNLMMAHAAFFGFLALWNPAGSDRWGDRERVFAAGLAGGTCVLLDYSGVIALAGLFVYAFAATIRGTGLRGILRGSTWYGLGAALPILLLWFYQWRSFGNPFFPGQHWMPAVEWSDRGYQGYGFPQLELLWSLLVDHKYGLFVSCPLFLLALAYPLVARRGPSGLPKREAVAAALLTIGFWVFFAGSNYTQLQWNTGIRYLAPVFPFLFLLCAVVLMRMRRPTAYFWISLSGVVTVSMCMYRNVANDLGVLDPIVRTFIGGFQLPALLTMSRVGDAYGSWTTHGIVSPFAAFALLAVCLYGLWSARLWPTGADV